MKVWDKPELTVLQRGTAQEAVLAGCKQSGGSDNVTGQTTCYQSKGSYSCGCEVCQGS